MKEIYKGYKIEYNGTGFIFNLDGKDLGCYTVRQFRQSIDNFLNSKKLIGKKVIYWGAEHGNPTRDTIKRIEIDLSNISSWGIPINSIDYSINYYGEDNKRFKSRGPFLLDTEDNWKIVARLKKYKDKEREYRKKHDDLWKSLFPHFIDNWNRE